MSQNDGPSGRRGRLDVIGRSLETLVLTVLLGWLILVGFGQIVLRNVFSTGIVWADGSAGLAVLGLAVVGALAAARDRRHIAIGLADRMLPSPLDRWARVAVNAFAAVVTGSFALQAFRFVADSRAFDDVLFGSFPAWIGQAVLPIGFGLMACRYAIECFVAFRARH